MRMGQTLRIVGVGELERSGREGCWSRSRLLLTCIVVGLEVGLGIRLRRR